MIRRCLAYLGVVALTAAVAVVGTPAVAFADEVRDSQWYLETLNINEAHELSQGEGVTIGVIDSGIDATHPDLENNVKPGKDYGDSKDDGLHDARDHGTSTASILAAHGHGDGNQDGMLGIAPKAEIISVGIHSKDENWGGTGARIAEAITWLVDQDVDIISISMSNDHYNPDSVEYAADHDVPVVASAGNTKVDYGDALGVQETSGTGWPARAANAIPVTGTNENGKFWEDSLTLVSAAQQPQYGLAAPATDLPGAMPGGDYATNSGTSGSAPIVAGTLALIKSAYPDLDYHTWLERMLGTVDDKGEEGFDDEYGWGIVNPLKALTEDIKFDDGYTELESLAEDRLPLEEQGKGTGDSGDGSNEDGAADGNPIAAATGLPVWLLIAVIAGLLILAAAVITIVFTQRHKKRQAGNSPPSGGIPGPGMHNPGTPPPGADGAGTSPANAVPGSPTTQHDASPPGAGPLSAQHPGTGTDNASGAAGQPPAHTPPSQPQAPPDATPPGSNTPFTPPQ